MGTKTSSAAFASILALFAIPLAASCGGSTEHVPTDPGGNTGGSGGSIIDSGTGGTATTDAADAANADVDGVPDSSVDATPDVTADQATPDAEPPEASLFDLTMPDVALNDSGATVQGCYDCMTVECTAEMQACQDDSKCSKLLLCLFIEQCFGGTGPGGIDQSCAFGCLGQAGITSFNDPAISLVMDAGTCLQASCSEPCAVPAEGGLPGN